MTSVRNVARAAALLAALGALTALAGCSREILTVCAAEGDYLGASTAPPLRVPDDLSLPDESQALRVPEIPIDRSSITGCLDAPPLFSDIPGLLDPPEKLSRRERREQRRAVREAAKAREAAEGSER